ncbi:MAG: GTP-dependent nucleic acid-binding protein engD [Candidatus Amesbacteria bacterium GW2011_GWB1_48_13]|uniref:GTP-dependent nucleic acid-binding protein engD n=1 Tax=Candidatus Amesbacteria bacterium GW2011_GWB1_48_13 TaxID=1618362 RepID=A0A0G1UPJ5_9BACT|nr:MAG: GTP-dependent nucleic acid-binding protein engD [Candidatus Amesbacteria bacterium GW2011_GWB1_48_13]
MNLSVGIVGLPNVGKSTLFNALHKKQAALAANYPFATIEPNVGVVPVPDPRLAILADVVMTEKIVPATVKFVDIAGLVAGASKGEGLGNKFLAHIREVDAICHVVRKFADENIVREGSVDPKSDFEIIKTELELADLETEEKRAQKKKEVVEELPQLSKKPTIVVLNADESDLKSAKEIEAKFAAEVGLDHEKVIVISARTESELAALSDEDARVYLQELGIENSGLERLVQRAFEILGLQTFLTAGEKETRAWTIKRGTKAPQAAGVIHTDFEKHFIKADVINWRDFTDFGGWTKAREAGKVRLEGRDYVMREGDVVEFKVGV